MKRKIVWNIVSYSIFFLYFMFLGILIPFLMTTPLESGGFKTVSSENDWYEMIDNYYDPDEFSAFRSEAENINKLSLFYNELNKSECFKVLTSFNQAITVETLIDDNRFCYNSEEFMKEHPESKNNVKALQLNQNAYDAYHIEVDSGQLIAWDDITYQNMRIPVLLGADYKEYYKQGDIIRASYYNKDVEFEVTGFLKRNCLIDYNSVYEVNLDTYMLIPYPKMLWEVKHDFQFESILYFAMINCKIVPLVNEAEILKEIKKIADNTGFTNFSLVGIDDFQIQNINLLLFIKKYQIYFVLLAIIGFIVMNVMIIKIYHRIYGTYHKKTLCRKTQKLFAYRIIIPYTIVFTLSLVFSVNFLHKRLPISIFIELIGLAVTYITIYMRNFPYKREDAK